MGTLSDQTKDGRSDLELLAAGEYAEVKLLLTVGNAHAQLAPLDPAVAMARIPANPADLVDALQDPIHHEVGKSRLAKSLKVQPRPDQQ